MLALEPLDAPPTQGWIHHCSRMIAAMALAGALVQPFAAEARPAPDGFTDLAARVTPAVINISTTQIILQNGGPEGQMPGIPPGSPFGESFKRFMPPQGQATLDGGAPETITALGSGFVVGSAGHVATNGHVASEADKIPVTFQDAPPPLEMHHGSRAGEFLGGLDSRQCAGCRTPLYPSNEGSNITCSALLWAGVWVHLASL